MKIDVKDLVLEIQTAIEDLFEADLRVKDNFIALDFINGQKFHLKIEEK